MLTSKEWNNTKPLLFFFPTSSFWPSPDFVKALTPWSSPSPSCVSAKPGVAEFWPRRQEGRFPGRCASFSPRFHTGQTEAFPETAFLCILLSRVCLRQQDLRSQAFWISNPAPRQEKKLCSCLFSPHHLSSVYLTYGSVQNENQYHITHTYIQTKTM